MSFSTAGNRATFVLIPGAGTDPGAWQWTIAELRARGHEAVAPPLPLDDPEAGPVAHAAAVVDAARDLPWRLVVVGQSLARSRRRLSPRACRSPSSSSSRR
jgi:hypothetical protein